MTADPSAIPEELYAALICSFNDMNLEQKEKFIECAYVLGGFYCSTSPNSIGSGKYKYQISDVFSATVTAYAEFLSTEGMTYDSNNAYMNQLIGNYSLMQSVRFQGSELYVYGFYFAGIETIHPIDVTLTVGSKENDYFVKYNGSDSPYNKYGMTDYSHHDISTYGMRYGDGIDSVFDKQVIELSESLRVDINQENFENVISGVSDILLGFVEVAPIVSVGMSTSSIIIGCTTTSIEGNITNNTVDQIQNLLEDGNTYKALSVHISFGICDGVYQIYAYGTDKTHLETLISVYTLDTEKEVGFTADNIIEAIHYGNLEDVPGLSELVDWYMDDEGEQKMATHLNLEEQK